jgi:hypothetical protein
MRGRGPLWILSLALGIVPAWADDSLDNLFDQPAPDVVVEAPAKAAIPQVNQVLRPFGTVSFNLAGVWGQGGSDTSTVGVDSTWTVGVDARPDDTLRIQGSLTSSLPTGKTLSYSTPVVNELFADYAVGSLAVVRVGQFGVTWGQARLVSNVGNLIASANPGFSAKAAVPVGTGTLTLFSSAIGGFDNHQLPLDYQYAGAFDQTLGPVTLGGAYSYRKNQVWQASAYGKTSFWGWDWYGEAVGTFHQTDSPWDRADALAGGNWQGWFPVWTLNTETLVSKFKNHPELTQYTTEASLSIDGKVPWSGFTPKLLGAYAWDDRSGELIASVVYQPVGSSLSFTLGLPWIFGDDGTRFVTGNPDSSGRRYGIGVKASLSYSF